MQGAACEACLELAQLHSDAVDFPKTGRVVELPHRLMSRKHPDFMDNMHKYAFLHHAFGRTCRQTICKLASLP